MAGFRPVSKTYVMDITEMNTAKGSLLRYFDVAHEAVLWKVDGLSEYDLRRPMTQTGTNLLGVVKHLAYVEAGYFGQVFGGTNIVNMPDGEPNADMFATADETSEHILSLFKDVWAGTHEVIERLGLDAEGHVFWWGEDGNPVTVQRVLVHVTTEIYRHLGQMDIVRESIDGAAGMREESTNMPDLDNADWASYCARLDSIARTFAD